MWVCLTDVSVVDGNIEAEYDFDGFTPNIDQIHFHFYGDAITDDNAGSQGSGPWLVHAGQTLTANFFDPPATAQPVREVLRGAGQRRHRPPVHTRYGQLLAAALATTQQVLAEPVGGCGRGDVEAGAVIGREVVALHHHQPLGLGGPVVGGHGHVG